MDKLKIKINVMLSYGMEGAYDIANATYNFLMDKVDKHDIYNIS